MNIILMAKGVYGKILYYPSCEKAEIICQLVGKKTLDVNDISKIKALGFEVEITHFEVKA